MCFADLESCIVVKFPMRILFLNKTFLCDFNWYKVNDFSTLKIIFARKFIGNNAENSLQTYQKLSYFCKKFILLKEIVSIVKTFFGYLVRPSLYPELFRKIYKNIFQRGIAVKGKDESITWSEKIAISEAEAIEKFFGKYEDIKQKYSADFSFAENAEKTCPVKMGGAGALNLIYYLCEKTEAINVLETGVAYGWSSLAALLSLQHRNGTLYSSDMPYLDRNNDKFVGCVVNENLRKFWKLFRFADKESLPKIFQEQNSFEVIHYDSDKSYNGRLWAYPILWNKLNSGGFFISDDIQDNAAFKHWCEQNKLQATIIDFEGKYVGIVQKS